MSRTPIRILLWSASGVALVAWLALAWRALTGGVPADPVETAALDMAARFAHGRPPYAEAHGGVSLMPVLPLLTSWLQAFLDDGVWAPRLASLLSTLFTAAAVASIVRNETQSHTLGITAAALALTSQGLVTGTAAFARPEPLMLLLVVAGAHVVRWSPRWTSAVCAALVMAIACFTHPAALAFALAVLLHLAVHDRRRALTFGFALTALVAAGHVWSSRALGPWYNDAAWDAGLRALRFAPTALVHFTGGELLGTLGVFTLATVLSFALPVRPWRGAVGVWTWLAFAALVSGVLATQAGLPPAEAVRIAAPVAAIVGTVSAQRVTQHLSTWPGGTRLGGHAVVLTALALQFVTLLSGGLR